MESFFNDMSVPAKFLLAFIVVLAILGAAGYLMRRISSGSLTTSGTRGRHPRLAVIEDASVDGRRRLVLVRRDNVEHLLLIGGGSTDIVVEPNISRAAVVATASSPVRDAKMNASLEAPSRQASPLEGSGWATGEPAYVEPPRPARETVLRPPPAPERQRLGGFVEDAGAPPLLPTPPAEPEPAFQPPPVPRSFEPVFQIPAAPEPKRMPAAPPLPPRPAQSEESNLAEMAQRLEAALRRPIKPVEPVTSIQSPSPLPSSPPPSPPAASRFTAEPPPLEMPPRVAPPPTPVEFIPPPAPPGAARESIPPLPTGPIPELAPIPPDTNARPAPVFASIEEEMASLLSRSSGKS
jgi:flagellar protein FliO/FliZ